MKNYFLLYENLMGKREGEIAKKNYLNFISIFKIFQMEFIVKR